MSRLNKIKNPFSRLSDEEWKKYANEKEPHFTEEPHYEIVPWSDIKARIEDNAETSGFDLVLRTTNNKAYCPDHFDYEWIQKTQWLFGYKNKRIFVHITYTEQKTLSHGWKNFVDIDVHLEVLWKERDVTDEYIEFLENDDVTRPQPCRFKYGTPTERDGRYYAKIYQKTCPMGYFLDGGMVDKEVSEFRYTMVEGSHSHSLSHLPWFENLKKVFVHPGYTNDLERCITPTFFSELIEKNLILDGKMENIHMWHYSDTFSFPGKSKVLCLWMDYLFLKKLMQSQVANYITHPWQREISTKTASFFWDNSDEFERSCSYLERKIEGFWYPAFHTNLDNLIENLESSLRLTPTLQKLIDDELATLNVF